MSFELLRQLKAHGSLQIVTAGRARQAVNWLAASSSADVPPIDWGHLKIRCINLCSNDHTTRAGSPTRPQARPGQASTARG